ncbi:MAG: ATP-binding protein [Pannonibacter sp.]
MDQHLTTFLALSAHAELAPLIVAERPAWLWNATGDRVLWANAAGAAFFDARSPQALASLSGLDRAQARPHLARIATTGPVDRPSLERLRFYKGLKVVLFTCQCRRLVLGTGESAALIMAADGPVQASRPDAEFLALIAAGAPGMTLALSDAAGQLVAREGADANALPAVIPPQEDLVQVAGRAHNLIRLPLGTARHLMIVDEEPAEEFIEPEPSAAAEAEALTPAETVSLVETAADLPDPAENTDVTVTVQDTTAEVTTAHVDTPADIAAPQPQDLVSGTSTSEAAASPLEQTPAMPSGDTSTEVDATAGSFALRDRPVRFAWKMDVDQRFTFLSPEFADVLGSRAADIVGMTWAEVAARFGLDPRGSIARALSRRDTWSGKTVDWPVPGSGLRVPVDMAALPAFDRRRVFEGYRGFGVLRPADALEDEEIAALEAQEELTPEPAGAEPLETLAAPVVPGSEMEAAPAEADASAAGTVATVPEPAAETTLADVIVDVAGEVPAGSTALALAVNEGEATATTANDDANGAETLALVAVPTLASAPATGEPVETAPSLSAADSLSEPVNSVELTPAEPESEAVLPAPASEWIADLKAAPTPAKDLVPQPSTTADLFEAPAARKDDTLAGIDSTRPLPPKEIEKAVRTLAREFDAVLERRAARKAAEAAPVRAYREPPPAEPAPARIEQPGVEAAPAAVAPVPATPEPQDDPAQALVSALAAAGPQIEEIALTAAERTGDSEALPAAEEAVAVVEDAVRDEAEALVAPAAEDAVPVEADAAETAYAETLSEANTDSAPQSLEDEIHPELQPASEDAPSTEFEPEAESPAAPVMDALQPAADPVAASKPESRVVPFTAPGGIRVPRMVPVDTSRLTKPERAAFRKIAEALGARLEGDFEEEEDDAAAAFAAQPAPPAEPQRPVAPPAEPIDPRLLDRLPIGIGIVRDREVLYANETLLALLGYPNIEALEEAGGFEAIFVDPEHMPGDRLEGTIDEAMLLRRANGRLSPVDARMHTVPWNGGRGLMVSIVERVTAPAATVPAQPQPVEAPQPSGRSADTDLALSLAREQIAEMDTILETATDGVLLLDRFGTILKANGSAEALFGAARSDLVGAPLTEFLAQESHRSAMDYLDGLARNGVASVLNDGREVIGQVSSGGLIPLFMTIGRLGSGEGLKFCAVLRDITQWKAAEEELTKAKRQAENASSQKSDFLAKISHEIRTPLNAIIGFSEVMIEERFGTIGNERYKEYLKDIRTSGSHIMSLINDLLDLSKIEAGKMDLTFEAVSANDIVRECVALMQPQANRERVIIRASLPGTVPNVVADLRSLRQIVLNLLSNAIKFNKSGGQVIVSTALEPSGEVVLRVRDTGTGMNAKDLAAALEPFRQVHTARHGGGTGLGLPLTKALVEANRACFKIDSVPDQGTLVEITFPPQRVLAE